jgi:hypothetical protein
VRLPEGKFFENGDCEVKQRLCCRNIVQILTLCLLITDLVVVPVQAGWAPHMVQQVNGFDILAEAQLPSVEIGWNKMLSENHLVYMPSYGPQGRMLISVVDYAGIYPNPSNGLVSDDFGTTWSYQYLPVIKGLTYFGETPLGNGKVMMSSAGSGDRWLSNNYGVDWQVVGTSPTLPNGDTFYRWDPLMVDKNASGYVTRLAEGGYTVTDQTNEFGFQVTQGHIRFSTDEGYSFPQVITPPQWLGVSEIALTRAANGDIVASCRTNISTAPPPGTYATDFYSGLGTSVSQDNGLTWSPVNHLYEYGRHMPSTALLPNGDLVMSYVVRAGYGRDPENNRERFGIEAVVSHDNGQTWDMDNRYILDQWTSTQDGTDGWMSCPQSTTTVVLPDGSILTEYGTGENVVANTLPRDVKIVHWSLAFLLGDANGDGVVSAGDYAAVQANFGNTGTPGILGDANGDGVVSAGDYAAVQANFGNTASAIVTPEPTTIGLMMIDGIVAVIRKRK